MPAAKKGRPSKSEKKRAQELRAQRVPLETIAKEIGRDATTIMEWSEESARQAAHAAANGTPPPSPPPPPGAEPPPSGSAASAGAPGSGPGPGPGAGPRLSPEAVVAVFEMTRAVILEGACIAAKVDSSDERLKPYVEFPERHRNLLTFCAPVLVSSFEKWLSNDLAALCICGGVMVASCLPAAHAIKRLGKEMKAEREEKKRKDEEAKRAAPPAS